MTSDFQTFYEETHDLVFGALLLSTGNRTRAEEAVAEAFTRAFRHWEEVARHPIPRAWVIRVALNVDRSWRRRIGRREVADVPDRPAPAAVYSLDLEPELRSAILRLPRREREVVVLRHLFDLQPAEIAEVLGIAYHTVGVHHYRAMRKLRQAIITEPMAAEPSAKERQS